jgi:arylsulfatase A-like enzyme
MYSVTNPRMIEPVLPLLSPNMNLKQNHTMKMKSFLIILLATSTFGLARAETKRPNILWIIAEDLSPFMGCYGDEINRGHTPHIDKLASEGVLFKRAYANAPVCSASRSSFITGAMQTTTGIHLHRSSRTTDGQVVPENLRIHLPKGMKTLPELMKQQGYFTFNNGKEDYNFHYDRRQLYDVGTKADYQAGMNGWQGNSAQNSRSWTKDVWSSRPDRNQPWFGQIQIQGGKGDRKYIKPDQRVDRASVTVPPYYPEAPAAREAWALHYDEVRGSDTQVAKIIEQLRLDGELDNTIVIFFSDHGSPSSLRHKQFCYEGGLHVPLMITGKHPWITQGKVVNDLVSLIDLTATTLALAGGKIPEYYEGRNLFTPKLPPAEYVVGARDRCDYSIDMSRTVRTENMRYIRNYHTDRIMMQSQYRDDAPYNREMRQLHQEGKLNSYQEAHWFGVRPFEELYDLMSDPHQVKNLATDPKHRSELLRHRKLLDDWSIRTDDKGMYAESTVQLRATFDLWNEKPSFKSLELNPEYKAFR